MKILKMIGFSHLSSGLASAPVAAFAAFPLLSSQRGLHLGDDLVVATRSVSFLSHGRNTSTVGERSQAVC